MSGANTRETPTSSANIVARYQVNGREYTTDTRHFGQTLGSTDTSEAELLRLRYRGGSIVTVSYSPASPEISALEPGFDAESLWLPGSGLAFALIAVMFAIMYRISTGSSSLGMSIGVSVFAAIFMMSGLPMMIFGSIGMYRAHASQFWPETKGEIVYDEVDATTTEASSSKRRTTAKRTTTTYGARIIFRYDVNGKRHYSNTRRFGALSERIPNGLIEIADNYPQGLKLPVKVSSG